MTSITILSLESLNLRCGKSLHDSYKTSLGNAERRGFVIERVLGCDFAPIGCWKGDIDQGFISIGSKGSVPL